MARADHRGLCGGNDRPLRHQGTSPADRPEGDAGRKPVLAALLALALAAPAAAQAPATPGATPGATSTQTAPAQTAPAQTAPAQTAPDARTLALAAGVKALFTCSGTFVAGMSEADIAANDLEGGYPGIQESIAQLDAKIDRRARRVEVAFDQTLPPRVARFANGRGCSLLPVGADPARVMPPPQLIGGPVLKTSDARPWPTGDATATARLPAAARKVVDALMAEAIAGGSFGKGARTSAVLIVKDGRIVAERYARGVTLHTPQRTWSVAKSLTSALVGRGAMLRVLDPMRPAHVPEWGAPGDPRAALTVDQLLRMQSGLWTNGPGSRTDALYFGGATVAETAAVAPLEAAPGTRFNYANNDTLLAARALMTDLGEAAPGFATTQLLWPIGMTRTTIEADWQGNPVLSSQVWMTARDLARLALLHLNDGVWQGTRLLPEGWVADATTPRGPQPPGERGQGYGRAIWLLGPNQGLPPGSYGFFGNRGQLAIVVPSAKLVVVRRGFDAAGAGFDGPGLTRELLKVLG